MMRTWHPRIHAQDSGTLLCHRHVTPIYHSVSNSRNNQPFPLRLFPFKHIAGELAPLVPPPPNCVFLEADAYDAKSFDPFTHVYMFGKLLFGGYVELKLEFIPIHQPPAEATRTHGAISALPH